MAAQRIAFGRRSGSEELIDPMNGRLLVLKSIVAAQ
jgi:hypothetical protein